MSGDLERRVAELEARVIALTAYIDGQWQRECGRPFDDSIKMDWPGDVHNPAEANQ